MLIPLIIVPLASFIWAIASHIDKHLVEKISLNQDTKGLIVFSSLVAGLLLVPFSLILSDFNVGIDLSSLLLMIGSSVLFLIGTSLYLKALKDNDTSVISAMFQLMPIFGYFLGLIFLNEVLTTKQIIGCLIVIVSSVAISFEIEKMEFKLKPLLYMILATISYAIYFLLFRIVTIEIDFVIATFWFQIGLIINGLLLVIFLNNYRNSFISMIKYNGKKVFIFNIINETLNIIANILVNYAITFIPLALVLTLNGLHPFFVFMIGIIGTLIYPKVFNDNLDIKYIIKNLVCIILSIIGLAILYL